MNQKEKIELGAPGMNSVQVNPGRVRLIPGRVTVGCWQSGPALGLAGPMAERTGEKEKGEGGWADLG
jgi:hypothetical protein